MTKDLWEKVAWVTGGSSGIGRVAALAAALPAWAVRSMLRRILSRLRASDVRLTAASWPVLPSM